MTVHVVGLGVIGSSLARELAMHGWSVTGEDINDDHDQFALAKHWIKSINRPLHLDLVILAIPHSHLIMYVKNNPWLRQATCVCDMSGLKTPIVETLTSLLNKNQYVSLHPMRGHPLSGPQHSESVSYQGALMLGIATTLTSSAEAVLDQLVDDLQCEPITWMSSQDHDAWIAYSSHLPHLLAKTFATLTPPVNQAKPGTSMQTFLRLASMNVSLWTTLLQENQTHLLPLIQEAMTSLQTLQGHLKSNTVNAWLKPKGPSR
jgi:prephenate dehydrogenase